MWGCAWVCVQTLQGKDENWSGPLRILAGPGAHPPLGTSPMTCPILWASQAFLVLCRQPPPFASSESAVDHSRSRTCLSGDLGLPEASL